MYTLQPGERTFSETQTINAGDITGELFARLYDEAANKGRLCIHIFLSLDILIGDTAGRDNFAVTIPLEIRHLSTLGNTDCVNTGECVPTLTELVDVTTFSDTNWKRNGAAKYKNGHLYINGEYDCSLWCTALYGSAWYVLFLEVLTPIHTHTKKKEFLKQRQHNLQVQRQNRCGKLVRSFHKVQG